MNLRYERLTNKIAYVGRSMESMVCGTKGFYKELYEVIY